MWYRTQYYIIIWSIMVLGIVLSSFHQKRTTTPSTHLSERVGDGVVVVLFYQKVVEEEGRCSWIFFLRVILHFGLYILKYVRKSIINGKMLEWIITHASNYLRWTKNDSRVGDMWKKMEVVILAHKRYLQTPSFNQFFNRVGRMFNRIECISFFLCITYFIGWFQ